ncbi:MAG: hypothetical protein Q8S19_01505, partial [Bacillota bacterium]|nr:hypothetical protein [Bacillota bacterium]
TFAPIDVLEGRYDLVLRARDSIILVKKTAFGGSLNPANIEKFSDVLQLTGQVARPEAYAYRKGMKLSQVLTKDQILLDTNLNYAEITRHRADGKNEYITFRPSDVLAGTWNFDLGPRDVIRLLNVGYDPAVPDFERYTNAVKLSGPVKFAGLYAWKSGMKLSTLLGLAKPAIETNQVYAEVIRPLGGTQYEYLTFSPRELASGTSDIELKARDVVRLYTAAPTPDLDRFAETVTIAGTVRYVGPYARTANLKLSSIVTAEQMLDETNLDYAELTRRRADGTPEYQTFAPIDVLEGRYDLVLRARDSISLVKKTAFGGSLNPANIEMFSDVLQLTG